MGLENLTVKYDRAETEKMIENGVGEISAGLFRLMEDGLKEEAYQTMGVILNMLLEDRDKIRMKGFDNE
jgi:hypothetical protein